jgi:hypothetical protein
LARILAGLRNIEQLEHKKSAAEQGLSLGRGASDWEALNRSGFERAWSYRQRQESGALKVHGFTGFGKNQVL